MKDGIVDAASSLISDQETAMTSDKVKAAQTTDVREGVTSAMYQVLFGAPWGDTYVNSQEVAQKTSELRTVITDSSVCKQKNQSKATQAMCKFSLSGKTISLFDFFYWLRQMRMDPHPELDTPQKYLSLGSLINVLNPSNEKDSPVIKMMNNMWTGASKMTGSSVEDEVTVLSDTLRMMIFPVVHPLSVAPTSASKSTKNPDGVTVKLSSVALNQTYHDKSMSKKVKGLFKSLKADKDLVSNMEHYYMPLRLLDINLNSCHRKYEVVGESKAKKAAHSAKNMGGKYPDYKLYTYSEGDDPIKNPKEITCSSYWPGEPLKKGAHITSKGNGFPGIWTHLETLVTKLGSKQPTSQDLHDMASASANKTIYAKMGSFDVLKCLSDSAKKSASQHHAEGNSQSTDNQSAIEKATGLACQEANLNILQLAKYYNHYKSKYKKYLDKNQGFGDVDGSKDGKSFVTNLMTYVEDTMKSLEVLFVFQAYPHVAKEGLPKIPNYNDFAGVATYVHKDAASTAAKSTSAPPQHAHHSASVGSSLHAWVTSTHGPSPLRLAHAHQQDTPKAKAAKQFLEIMSGSESAGQVFVPGIPFPYDQSGKDGSRQVISEAGATMVLVSTKSSKSKKSAPFISDIIQASIGFGLSGKFVVAIANDDGMTTNTDRQNYYKKLNTDIQKYQANKIKGLASKSFALGVMHDFAAERSTSLKTSAGFSITPMQIILQNGSWRLRDSQWSNSIKTMDNDNLLREIAYMLAEQQFLMTEQLVALKEIKFLKAMSSMTEAEVPSFGSGSMSGIKNQITNYIAGRDIHPDMTDPAAIQKSVSKMKTPDTSHITDGLTGKGKSKS